MTWRGAIYDPMYVDRRLPGWARQLDAAFDVLWTTSWNDDAVLETVAQPLGLPDWPVLAWDRFSGAKGRLGGKTAGIATHLVANPRSFAWADDCLERATAPAPLHRLDLDYVLIRPRATVGLTPKDIEALLTFAASISKGTPLSPPAPVCDRRSGPR